MVTLSHDDFGPELPTRYGASPPQRLLAWAIVAGVHGVVLAGLLLSRVEVPSTGPALVVSVVSSPSPAQPTPPAPPTPVVTPKPVPLQPLTLPIPAITTAITAPAAVAAAPPSPPSSAPTENTAPAVKTTPPDFTAAYLNNPGPQYPVASRRKREQGTVLLKVHVSADGQPLEVLVDRSSGYPELDQAALGIVKTRWRFVPATRADRPVDAWVAVPLVFALKSK